MPILLSTFAGVSGFGLFLAVFQAYELETQGSYLALKRRCW